jgi:hypothetical protein
MQAFNMISGKPVPNGLVALKSTAIPNMNLPLEQNLTLAQQIQQFKTATRRAKGAGREPRLRVTEYVHIF